MTVQEVKQSYLMTLNSIYPENECLSFFNLLAEHILNMSRIDLALNPKTQLSELNRQQFEDSLMRLKNSEPIQYIIGETEFFGMTFKVNEHVLIPRPETEELVEWVIKSCSVLNDNSQSVNILDIGTGSGCIPIALAKHLPHIKIFALDVSEEALIVAKSNAELNNVDISFIHADILNEDTWDLEFQNLKFDIIVSNPPYVRQSEKQLMKPNVLNNEPHLALFVDDEDPLLFYKVITEFTAKNLINSGQLYFEINEYLGDAMKQLLCSNKYQNIELRQDMFGKDRMIKGIKS